MKTYRVLIKITETYAINVEATSADGARKVAEVTRYSLEDKLVGAKEIAYEVLDNDFDTTN